MINKLSHTTLYVTDQAKAYDIYVNKLGFTIGTDMTMDNGFRWLTVRPPEQPDVEIVLAVPNPPMFSPELVPHIQALLQHNAMGGGVWETNDCQKAYEKMMAKGIEFLKPPTKEFYGIEALFRDGCGNWFSLTQRVSE